MNTGWVTSCDMLADAGIIDFDAAAYITGTKPRYMGQPNVAIYQIPPLNYSQPPKDEFQNSAKSDNNIVKNPAWKKVLFSVLAAVGLIWGAKKIGKLPTVLKDTGVKNSDWFKNLFKKWF